MENNQEHVESILDYLQGKASEEQVEFLKKWLSENADNKKIYKELVKSFYQLHYHSEWERIDQLVAQKRTEPKLKSNKKIRPYWLLAAASILVLFGVSFSILFSNQSQNELQQTAQFIPTIELRQQGAELILSNGKSLQLEKTQKFLQETDGSVLKIDSTKGIVYEASDLKGKELIYNTIKLARGQEYQLQLSDGTKVWLNADSELKFPVKFSNHHRKVFLKGEAYFEVAKNKTKAFVVNTFEQNVKVYGTCFNINAYDESSIQTVLVEGSVGVSFNSKLGETKLQPGELLKANCRNGKISTQKVDVYPHVAWKDGNFVFRNECLENIMLRLERWYNIKVFFADNKAKKQLIIGDMKRYDSIDKLLYFIEKGTNVAFERNHDVVIVKSKR